MARRINGVNYFLLQKCTIYIRSANRLHNNAVLAYATHRAMTERRAGEDRDTKYLKNDVCSCVCHFFCVTLQPKVAKTMEIQHLHSIQEISKQYMTGDLPVLVLCSDTQQYICKYMRPNNSNYGK